MLIDPHRQAAAPERRTNPRWSIALGLLTLQVLIVVGTFGYWWLEGWSLFDSLWMVIITLTTVGYGDIYPQTVGGRAFTLAILLSGLGLATWSVGAAVRYVVEGELARDLASRRRRRVMESLQDHYVVVGLGRLGREVAVALHEAGRMVAVVDVDARQAESFPHCALSVVGDGSSDVVLEAAGIRRAAGLAVATASDAINVFVTLSARQLNPEVEILTRIDDPENASKAHQAGADAVIRPYHIGGTRMAHALLHPHSARFIEHLEARHVQDLAMDDVRIGPPLSGPLRDLNVRERFGVLVVSVRREDGAVLTTPGPETMLQPGDVAVVVGTLEGIARFASAAR